MVRAVAAAEEQRRSLAAVASQVERHRRARIAAEKQAAAATAAAVAAGVSKHRAAMAVISATHPPKPKGVQVSGGPVHWSECCNALPIAYIPQSEVIGAI